MALIDELRFPIEIIIMTIAIAVMIVVLMQQQKLLKILEGSKVAPQWRQARAFTLIIAVFFFFFAATRILATISNQNEDFTIPDWLVQLGIGRNHNMMMNSGFLITSVVLFITIRVDIKAYDSLFTLIKSDN